MTLNPEDFQFTSENLRVLNKGVFFVKKAAVAIFDSEIGDPPDIIFDPQAPPEQTANKIVVLQTIEESLGGFLSLGRIYIHPNEVRKQMHWALEEIPNKEMAQRILGERNPLRNLALFSAFYLALRGILGETVFIHAISTRDERLGQIIQVALAEWKSSFD